MLTDVLNHVGQRSTGEKNLINTFALHQRGIILGNRSATAAEDGNIAGAALAQLSDDLGKKFDVPAVVARDADRSHVLLNSSTDDITDITMETQVDHFDAVPNEFQIDGVNRAIMAVADWDRRKHANW